MIEFPVKFVSARVYEVKAERVEAPPERGSELPLQVNLATAKSTMEGRFGVRLDLTTRVPAGEKTEIAIDLKVEGIFQKDPEAELDDATLERFKSEDAAVVLWPYVRQYLHDLTIRLGARGVPPLPMLDARSIIERETNRQKKAKGGTKPKRARRKK